MIALDTSVWVDHLRRFDGRLAALISQGGALQHPFVTGEIGMGSFATREKRAETVEMLRALRQVAVVCDDEFHTFVTKRALHGTGIGFVDAHILASLAHFPEARLWTRDKRLATQAERIGFNCLIA